MKHPNRNEYAPIAWLIKECPNFYFMPSLRYDRIFIAWDSGDHNCPAYWKTKGYEAIPLQQCEDEAASHWIVNNEYGVFDHESANSAISMGKQVIAVKQLKNKK